MRLLCWLWLRAGAGACLAREATEQPADALCSGGCASSRSAPGPADDPAVFEDAAGPFFGAPLTGGMAFSAGVGGGEGAELAARMGRPRQRKRCGQPRRRRAVVLRARGRLWMPAPRAFAHRPRLPQPAADHTQRASSSMPHSSPTPPTHPPPTVAPRSYDDLIDPSLPPEEIRRLRRQLSNRESARRSRRRRQTQLSSLEVQLEQLRSGAWQPGGGCGRAACAGCPARPLQRRSWRPAGAVSTARCPLDARPDLPAPPRPAPATRPQSARACSRG